MSESTRSRIIDASIDLFSIKGYAETSIRDIAKKAGIKTSTIYYHFDSKEAILSLILSDYMDLVRNSAHLRKWHEKKHLVTSGEMEITTKDVMDYMFFSFEMPNAEQYRKMVKIICSEAVRNETVREYFRNQGNFSFNYIKSILDSLLVAGRIPNCDTTKLAAILYSITFSFMHLDSIDLREISKDTETDMFSLLEYILKIVMDNSL